jgi:hypothetical protein
MRVLVSSICNFWMTRKAVERARELDAAWAFPDSMPLVGEPEHFASGDEEDKNERWEDTYSLPSQVPRHDPVLLQVFDELGSEGMAGGDGDEIHCLEIPDDVAYYVGSYCSEWIAEQHREWTLHGDGEAPAGFPTFSLESRFVSRP